MSLLTPNQLLAGVEGRWLAASGETVDRNSSAIAQVVIDSRDVQPNDLFWALPGAQRDGADFVGEAFAAGACGVVTSKAAQPPAGCFALVVDDPRKALWQAARTQRREFPGQVIAVTGSVGKTTTRQLIDTVLRCRFSGTASPHNYNNQLGVPLTMLGWQHGRDYAVTELGASAAGEIRGLANLCQPQIGIITQIGEAHLGGFGSRQGVADAKAELLDALPIDGWAVLNADDTQLRRVASRSRARITWVGRNGDSDLTATQVESAHGWLNCTVAGHRLNVPVWGRHHLTGVLMAVAIGQQWGISWSEMSTALAEFEAPAMRCEVSSIRGANVINDTYNSNPTAMRAALELLRDFDSPGRRIALCGDMRELGSEAPRLHRVLGSDVVTVCGADVLIACGEHAAEIVAGAEAAGMPPARTFACRDPDEATPHIRRVLKSGDVLLVKGSRSLRLERCIEALKSEQFEGEALRRAA
jgi:UDP-N-acetylmuramoyl-tripeptide--D-alanyl-D-alanine ligase